MRRLWIAVLVLALPAAAFGQAGGPTLIQGADNPDAIPDHFIVVLNDGVDLPETASEMARSFGGTVNRVYKTVLHGFAVTLPGRSAEALAHDPRVAYVEQDQRITINATQNSPPSWGLDRVDQRDLPLDSSYTYNFDGTGVHAYIIDTGIRPTHVQFGGRASADYDTVGDGQNGIDCYGHGTHVAGTVGSASYGIAKNVRLHAVRVLNCSGSGTTSGVVAGIDWVASNHQSPAVANMSLGGGASSSIDTASNNLVASGVFLAVAAGNDSANACNYSPARAANVYTVGSTTISDVRSSFSNYGTCVEIFAPGSSITSTWHTSDTATNTISGTSMATPHVAGAGALLLDEDPTLTPSQVAQILTDNATSGRLSSIGSGSPNLLLYTLNASTPPPPPPPPPSCPDGSIDFTSYGLESYADQNFSNTYSVVDAATLRLTNNTWLRSTQSYTVTADTVIEFQFASGSQGEIHAIGFDENQTLNDSPRHFQFWGTQNWTGAGKAQVTPTQYSGGGSYETFQVRPGDFYTGGGMRLVFTNDNDAGSGNEGLFRCVRVFEDTTTPPPGNCTVDDDFEGGADGWTNDAASTCSTGDYVLATPTLVSNGGVVTQVGGDHTSGAGNAIFTATNSSAGVDDVDGGNCILSSPTWAVADASTLAVWYFHGQRDAGDDPSGDFFRLEVSTDGGGSWTAIATNGDATSNAAWTRVTAPIPAGSSVRLRVQASDGPATGDLVEAGIDDLSICPN